MRNPYHPAQRRTTRRLLIHLLVAAVLLSLLYFAGGYIESSSRADRAQALRRTLRQAAVHCYALEGFFPPDVAYLEDHYGLYIDRTAFIVHYSVFASNLMPDIDVIPRAGSLSRAPNPEG